MIKIETKLIQQYINTVFKETLDIDGVNGKKTKLAVTKYMEFLNITDSTYFLKVLKNLFVMQQDYKYVFNELYTPLQEFGKSFAGFDSVVFIAQFGLETGYLKSVIKGSCNLGNIKAKPEEDFVEVWTHEFIKGKNIKVRAKFKKYASYKDFFNDYLNRLLNLHRYETAKENISNPEQFYIELQRGGYATDPKYATKIFAIYKLMKYYEKIRNSLEV